MPLMGSAALIFVMASLGLPGLGNFIAEFLILLGSWPASHLFTVLATIGLVIATAYSLRLMQKVFLGPCDRQYAMQDLNGRELVIIISLVIVICWLGFHPQPVLNTTQNTAYVIR